MKNGIRKVITERTTPREVLVDLAYFSYRHSLCFGDRKPGYMIERLDDEERAKLKELKSDDIKNDGMPK